MGPWMRCNRIAMAQWPSRNWHDDMLDIFCNECFIFDIYLSRFCDDCTGSNVRVCNLFSMGMQFRTVQDLCETLSSLRNPFSVHIFSIICLAIPLMTRESYTRKSFYRKKHC